MLKIIIIIIDCTPNNCIIHYENIIVDRGNSNNNNFKFKPINFLKKILFVL